MQLRLASAAAMMAVGAACTLGSGIASADMTTTSIPVPTVVPASGSGGSSGSSTLYTGPFPATGSGALDVLGPGSASLGSAAGVSAVVLADSLYVSLMEQIHCPFLGSAMFAAGYRWDPTTLSCYQM